MLNDWFLPFSRCPVTQSALSHADADLLSRVNRAISRGRLVNCGKNTVTRPIDAALVNADHSLIYPIWGQIPALVPSEAIQLATVDTQEIDEP